MKLLPIAAALLAALPSTSAYWKGFNVGAKNPDGSCKTQADWSTAFKKLQALPGHFTSARLYASSDCDSLARAVPAALSTGTKIFVGVWTEDWSHYDAEKQALRAAISAHGSDWIVAISVGSEDLYRKDTTAETLAQQIYDVRGMVRAMGVKQEVGHVDVWEEWVDPSNAGVIKACDFIGLDAYPFFEGSTIQNSASTFWYAVDRTRAAVNNISPGKWVWVTETGWPVSGANFQAAVASTKNAQHFWRNVACPAFNQMHVFWYVYQDYTESPSFGIFNKAGKAIYDLYAC